jgi:hypothetical protein
MDSPRSGARFAFCALVLAAAVPQPSCTQRPLSDVEVLLLRRVHDTNLAAIRAAESARDQSTSLEVRQLAERIVIDRASDERRIAEVAGAHRVVLRETQDAQLDRDRMPAPPDARDDEVSLDAIRAELKRSMPVLRNARRRVRDRGLLETIDALIRETEIELVRTGVSRVTMVEPHGNGGDRMRHHRSRAPAPFGS